MLIEERANRSPTAALAAQAHAYCEGSPASVAAIV